MRRVVTVVLAVLALGMLPAGASAATQPVNVLFAAFSPTPLDVLPGETVEWSNVSERRHTVTADDASFDSGDLVAGGHFSQTFPGVGAYTYHCRVHASMVGEVNVRRVTLGTLPSTSVPAGSPVEFVGRTAEPAQPVTIERDSGGGFRPAGTAAPAADGTWRVTLTAQLTGDYRATVGADASETRRLLVSDRKLLIRRTSRGVAVTVTPSAPYARIVLEQYLRERFGWWPVARSRLDYVSRAAFRVKRPGRVRVLLVGRDAFSPVATSRVVSIKHGSRRRTRPHRG